MYTDTVQTFVIIAGAFALAGFCEYKLLHRNSCSRTYDGIFEETKIYKNEPNL